MNEFRFSRQRIDTHKMQMDITIRSEGKTFIKSVQSDVCYQRQWIPREKPTSRAFSQTSITKDGHHPYTPREHLSAKVVP